MKKFVGILILLGILMAVNVAAASIWTDKEDYSPGDIVYVQGEGFDANSNVLIVITRPNDVVDTGSASTNNLGEFTYEYDLDGVFGNYNVYATDGTNEATTTFTDSTIWTTDGYAQQKNAFEYGEVVGVDGEGLTPSVTLNYEIKDEPSGGNIVESGTVQTNADGGIVYTNGGYAEVWVVPPDYTKTGQHKIYVYDKQTKTKTFTVEPGTPQEELDFCDLPDSFKTTLVNNGARAKILGVRLGDYVDADLDGQPSTGADGDDLNGDTYYPPGDEDQVVYSSTTDTLTFKLTNVGTDGAYVSVYADLNGDSQFQTGTELIGIYYYTADGTYTNSLLLPEDQLTGVRVTAVNALAGGVQPSDLQYPYGLYSTGGEVNGLFVFNPHSGGPGVVPEFSTIGIIVSILAIVAIGYVFVIRKRQQ